LHNVNPTFTKLYLDLTGLENIVELEMLLLP